MTLGGRKAQSARIQPQFHRFCRRRLKGWYACVVRGARCLYSTVLYIVRGTTCSTYQHNPLHAARRTLGEDGMGGLFANAPLGLRSNEFRHVELAVVVAGTERRPQVGRREPPIHAVRFAMGFQQRRLVVKCECSVRYGVAWRRACRQTTFTWISKRLGQGGHDTEYEEESRGPGEGIWMWDMGYGMKEEQDRKEAEEKVGSKMGMSSRMESSPVESSRVGATGEHGRIPSQRPRQVPSRYSTVVDKTPVFGGPVLYWAVLFYVQYSTVQYCQISRRRAAARQPPADPKTKGPKDRGREMASSGLGSVALP